MILKIAIAAVLKNIKGPDFWRLACLCEMFLGFRIVGQTGGKRHWM